MATLDQLPNGHSQKRPASRRLTADAPAWITEELISETLVTWQPYYPERLTRRDAVEMLLAAGAVFDALGMTDE